MPRQITTKLSNQLALHVIQSHDIIKITIPGTKSIDLTSNVLGQQNNLLGEEPLLGQDTGSSISQQAIPDVNVSTVSTTVLADQYTADIRRIAEFRQTLGGRADKTEFDVQNIDEILGKLICDFTVNLDGASIVYSKLFIFDDNSIEVVQLLNGQITESDVEEEVVTFEVISDTSPGILTVSDRTLSRLCQFIFKDPDTCAYVGPGDVCTKIRDDAIGGCLFYNNRHRFGGIVFITQPPTSGITGGPTFGGGGGGGTGPGDPGDRGILKKYEIL